MDMSNYYVWLDAGHSAQTGGKRNTIANPKFYEYEFNNDIAVKLKARLEAHGITVYLTNTTPNGTDIPLTTRASRANNKWIGLGKPSNAIFVSIHANAAGSCATWANARGVEVYHAGNASAKSKKLAKLLTDQIYADLHAKDSGFRQRGVKSANFTVIRKANMPSVLIEHAFYDNRADLKLLQNNRADFVEADCKAICKYFGIEYNKKVQEQPKKDTQFKPYLARCTVDGLNCRKGAGTSYGIERQINKGVAITIVEEKMNGSTKWGKSLSGYWVALKYMQFIRYI